MDNLPVHWSEGMFLRPQHFQAADRFWTEFIVQQQRLDHQFPYGLYSLQISETALQNGDVDVGRVVLRTRDGNLISMGGKQSLERLPVGDLLAQTESATLFLACPRRKAGVQNVERLETPAAASSRRFSLIEEDRIDESDGGEPQPLEFLRLNCRLLAVPGKVSAATGVTGFESLPLARLRRSPETGRPEIDPEYVPPLLQYRAWPALDRDVVRPIYDQVAARIKVLREQVSNRGLSLSSREAGDLERVLMLHELNSAELVLRALTMIRPGVVTAQPGQAVSAEEFGVHPYELYTELCRVVGQLSIFLPERVVGEGEVPQYDHDHPGPVFRQLRTAIERRLNSLIDLSYEEAPFIGSGLRMSAQIKAKWLNSDWSWYVGVRGPLEFDKQRMIRVMTSQEFAWKLGSDQQVENLFNMNSAGLRLDSVMQPPTILPRDDNWAYFRVSKDGPAWQAVVKEESLAMKFQINVVANRNQLQGSRVVELKVDGSVRQLEFKLFAVPQLPVRGG